MKVLYAFFLSVVFLACNDRNETAEIIKIETGIDTESLSYLALGDSYTIGTSVKLQESFPYQLVDSLKKDQINLNSIKLVA